MEDPTLHSSKCNVCAFTSHQDINGTPGPVGHPANREQINTVASQYREGPRMVYGQAQRPQDDAQPHQHFQGLHHRQISQTSLASTGFQHPQCWDSGCSCVNSGHQPSEKANAYFDSSPHAAAHCNSHSRTSASENTLRQGFLKWFNLNSNNNQQQRLHLNGAFSACTSSVALTGDTLGVTEQTFSLRDHHSSVQNKVLKSNPRLHALLGSQQTNVNVELNTSVSFTSKSHCESQEVKSSLFAVNCGQTETQHLSPVGEMQPPTDDQILNFISEKLKYFTTVSSREEGKDGHTPQSEYNRHKSSVDHCHHCTTASDKPERPNVSCAEQYTAVVAGALQVNRSKANAELTARSEDTSDCTTAASKKYSAGTLVSAVGNFKYAPEYESVNNGESVDFNYPVKMHLDVTMPANGDGKRAHSDDCEDKTCVSSNDGTFQSKLYQNLNGMTTLHYSTALKEPVASLENGKTIAETDILSKLILQQFWNRDIGNIHLFKSTEYPQIMVKVVASCTKNEDKSPPILSESEMSLDALGEKVPCLLLNCSSSKQVKSLCLNSKHTNEKEKEDRGLKPIEAAGLDHIQSTVVTRNKTFILASPNEDQDKNANKRKNTSHEGLKDAGSVGSQTELSENKIQKSAFECKVEEIQILKDPQYEDISDDDTSQLLTNLSEDDNPQIVPEPDNQQALSVPPKNDKMQQCSSFGETYDLLCPKSDSDRLGCNTIHSVLYSSSSVFKDGDETDDGLDDDDDDDDDFIVIPISMSDIKLEPEDEAQGGPETVVPDDGEPGDKDRYGDTNAAHCELHCPVQEPEPSVFCELEEYATIQSFLRTKAVEYGACFVLPSPEHEMDPEPEDSCDTEDSCDYSSALAHNYMTVSRHLLKKSATPLPVETNHSGSEKERNELLAMKVQKGQTKRLDKLGYMPKLKELMDAKAASKHIQPKTNIQKISKRDVIIIDSDTEDECDHNCKVEVKGKRLRSKKSRLPSASSPAPECQPKVVVHDACSHNTETRGQLIETKADSEYIQHETETKTEDIVTLNSDTEDDSDQNYKQTSRRRPSGLVDSYSTPYIFKKKRPSPQNVDSESGIGKEKLQEIRLSPTNSSVPQHQSKLHGAQFKEVSQDTSSDLSLSIKKSGHGNEAKRGSERWQRKSSRHTASKRRVLQDSDQKKDHQISKKKEKMERTPSQVSKESDDAFFSRLKRPASEDVKSFCGPANKKPQRPVLSSEALPERQSQSVDKEADSTSGTKLLTCQVHRQDKDEPLSPDTPTATSKKVGSCNKNMHHQLGGFVPRPTLANDRLCATKKVKASALKPTSPSRQLLLPCLSSSTSNLPSASGQYPEARRSSELSQSEETTSFSSPSKTVQSTSVPRQHCSSFNLKSCLSYSNPLTLDHPSTTTEGPSLFDRMQLSAKERVIREFNEAYVPIRKDRRLASMGTQDALRTTNYGSRRKMRLVSSHSGRAPTQRNNSNRTALPLLKRCQNEARELTKARSRDATREQRYMMSEGYKWSEKSRAARPAKGDPVKDAISDERSG